MVSLLFLSRCGEREQFEEKTNIVKGEVQPTIASFSNSNGIRNYTKNSHLSYS